MNFKKRIIGSVLLGLCSIFLLPLLGIYLKSEPLGPYLEFPPLTHHVIHAKNSLLAFCLGALIIFLCLLPFLRAFYKNPLRMKKGHEKGKFPIWAYFGLMLMFFSWVVSWGYLKRLNILRPYSFTPLWLGFILFINGLGEYLTRESLFSKNLKGALLLFPLSALFWWYFEYLNRFVQNWYYIGVEGFSPLKYTIIASFSFSTVLPAVMSVSLVLWRLFDFKGPFSKGPVISFPYSRHMSMFFLVFFGLGFALIGYFPDYLFPLLWVSPLVIFCSFQAIAGQRTIFHPVTKGDWSRIVCFAISGLICGFFWEMWNFYSYPKWIYEIPFVGQFKVFEMPILGYFGYLPFGVECAVIAQLVLGNNSLK